VISLEAEVCLVTKIVSVPGAGESRRVFQAFWSPTTFDELSAEQGVCPVEEWDRLTVDWPEDADFDEFLTAVRSP